MPTQGHPDKHRQKRKSGDELGYASKQRSDRQEAALLLAAQGYSQPEIAQKLGISPSSIRSWLSRDSEFYKRWHKLVRVSATWHAPAALEKLVQLADMAVQSGDLKAARRALRDIIEIAGAVQSALPHAAINVTGENVILDFAGVSTRDLLRALEEIAGASPVEDTVATVRPVTVMDAADDQPGDIPGTTEENAQGRSPGLDIGGTGPPSQGPQD